MREEELIKKLQSVELPGIEMRSHRRRLRMALFNAYHQRQREVGILELAKSKVKGGIDTMIRNLVSRQPAWKTAVAGVLAVVLVAGLAIALPALTGQLPVALAAEIVRGSPEVRDALDGEQVVQVTILERDGDKVRVLVKGEGEFTYTIANVNLVTKRVTKVVEVTLPELSDEEKARAIEIAKADPKVQELLDRGGTIDKVAPLPTEDRPLILKLDEEGGITVDAVDGVLIAVAIVLDNQEWRVLVDLDKGEVDRILEPPEPVEPEKGAIFRVEGPPAPTPSITEAEKEEAVNIAKADLRVQELLDKGAEIVKVSGRFITRVVVEAEYGEEAAILTSVTLKGVEVELELPVEPFRAVVLVDLAEGKVVCISPEPMVSITQHNPYP